MDSSEQKRANISEKIYPEILFNFYDVTPLRIYNNYPPCNGRGPKDRKKILRPSRPPPPSHLRVLMTGPLPYLLVWIPPLPCKGIQDRLDPGFHSMTSITSGFHDWSLDSLPVELGFWIPVVAAIPDFLFLELYSGFQSPGFLISQAKIPGFLILHEKSDWFAYLLVVVIAVI